MADTTVSEVVARPVRTAVQAGPAWVITEFIDAFFWDMTDRQFGALVAVLLLLISWGQAAIENGLGKGFMRSVPPKKVPVVDTTPEGGR